MDKKGKIKDKMDRTRGASDHVGQEQEQDKISRKGKNTWDKMEGMTSSRRQGTWIVAGTWTRTEGRGWQEQEDNPKGKVPRARSRDTRHERGQDVNVDEDKERGKGKVQKGKARNKEGDTRGQGHKDDDDDKEETTRAESRTETMKDMSQQT